MKNYSQAGQDLWVVDLFKDRDAKTLFFLDIGANDGVLFSNTYLLEQMGWDGICVEPSRAEFNKLVNCRSTLCLDAAITDYVGMCGFIDKGLLGNVKDGDTHVCITFKELLQNSPKRIQYMSLDIEGGEYIALSKFPFNEYIIEAITVEHNLYASGEKLKEDIYNLLTSNGYIRVKDNVLVGNTYPFEDWYVHESMKTNML